MLATTLAVSLITAAPPAPTAPAAHASLLTQMEQLAADPAIAALAPSVRARQSPPGGDSRADGALNGAVLGGVAGWLWASRNGVPPTLPCILAAGLGALIGAEIDGLFDR